MKFEINNEKYENLMFMSYDEQIKDCCSDSEIYGYGVYKFNVFTENDKHYVSYILGSSCD